MFASETRCPHCGASSRVTRVGGAVAAVGLGVALSGCPSSDDDNETIADSFDEPAYGVPATESSSVPTTGFDETTDTGGDADTGGDTDTDTDTDSGSGTSTETGADSSG